MTTLVLADDHHLVRKALKILLQAEPEFVVIAEASDGREAIELVQVKKPTVLLLDLAMPGIHGLDVIRQVRATTRTKVIVVSMLSAEAYVIEALKSGASGYILKESMPDDLAKAIREASAGHIYLSTALPSKEILRLVKVDSNRASDPLSSLTRREIIVLQLAAEGNSNTQIARMLFLSPRTVESHRASLMRKLNLRTQTEIVRFAIRKNLLTA